MYHVIVFDELYQNRRQCLSRYKKTNYIVKHSIEYLRL